VLSVLLLAIVLSVLLLAIVLSVLLLAIVLSVLLLAIVLFVLLLAIVLSVLLLAIVLSVLLRFMDTDNPFHILKVFFYDTCRDTSFPYKNVLIYINNIHYFETLQQKLYLIINKLILVICHYTRVLIGLKS
jgi:hypothetical protein